MFDELFIDNFAGGGGASTGMEAAIGRGVDIAVNHDPEAVAMHRANHPHTLHLCQDVFTVDPVAVTAGRPVGGAWFSPDCTYFSKARGAKPIRPANRKRRDLAWVVIRWAKRVRPKVIWLENVEEFRQWGPLTREGLPCPDRRGSTFDRWCDELRRLGYVIEHRELRACDYGAPTIRKRLFVIARCDGQPIVWPEPTHGPGRKPYATAAQCIDWSLPCPSIFERKRPLAENTLKRIAAGVMRYVVNAAEPFIVPLTHHGKRRNHPMGEPLPTITGAHRGELALCSPTLVQTGYGEREGQAPRVPGLNKPLGTVVGTSKHALVSAFLTKHFGGMVGVEIDKPAPTVTARATQNQLTTAHMIKLRGTCKDGQDLREPCPTITGGGTHAGLVAALLVKYYGNEKDGLPLAEPIHTVPTRDRFGLVTVNIAGEPYVITDIGMRMLQPHELYRAQGFPSDYIHDHGIDEHGQLVKLTKTAQVRMCGNSVCPPVVTALIRANMPQQAAEGAAA